MSYIGNPPIVSATRTVSEFVATAGQTVFSPNGGYTVGLVDVIVNGATQQSTDFTATNGTTVTLATAARAGDDVRIVAYGNFDIANVSTTSLADGSVTTSKIADLAVTPAKLSQKMTLGTSVSSTSGTAIDFTTIPSWAKRITVLFQGVSTSGAAAYLLQIGSGSILSSGYSSYGFNLASALNYSNTTGFAIFNTPAAAQTHTGQLVLTNITGNVWVAGTTLMDTSGACCLSEGFITLSGALDRVRLTTGSGTNTFDAGVMNIMWEG